MIYAFIKKNHKHIPEDAQRKEIEKKAQSLGLKIDRYIEDDYALRYSELWMVKRGYGSGAFYKNIPTGSTLLLHSLYTLTNKYKVTLFLVLELIKRNIKICTATGDTLDSKDLKTLEILFELKDQFDKYIIGLTDKKRPYDNNRFTNKDCENIINMLNSGHTKADILKKYGCASITLNKWLMKWGILPKQGKFKLTEKRPFLKSSINRLKRRISATAIISEQANKMLEMEENGGKMNEIVIRVGGVEDE